MHKCGEGHVRIVSYSQMYSWYKKMNIMPSRNVYTVTFIYRLTDVHLQITHHLWTSLHLFLDFRDSWCGLTHKCIFFQKDILCCLSDVSYNSANHVNVNSRVWLNVTLWHYLHSVQFCELLHHHYETILTPQLVINKYLMMCVWKSRCKIFQLTLQMLW